MADKLYGPYGYMVGTIGSSEDEWNLRNDPSTDAEDFSEPLFAKRELLATRGRPMVTGEGQPRGTASAAEGEPVAWPEPLGFLKPEGPSTVGPRFVYARDRTETWMRQVFFLPVFAAEALAAERARADELQGLYDAAIQMYRQATDREGRLTVALAAAEARADRAEEDAKAGLWAEWGSLASLARDEGRDDIAEWLEKQTGARNILKETPHDER